MSARHVNHSLFCLFPVIFVIAGIAVADDSPPRRLQRDAEEDAELECFECSRGDLLTFDLVTRELIRRELPAGIPDIMRLMTEGRQGALVPLDDDGALKDFSVLHSVLNTTVGDYPKHVQIFATYTNEHGQEIHSTSSGTKIDPFHVLTAGHCVYMFQDADGNTVVT